MSKTNKVFRVTLQSPTDGDHRRLVELEAHDAKSARHKGERIALRTADDETRLLRDAANAEGNDPDKIEDVEPFEVTEVEAL